jgi:hypothetical protein
MSLTGKLRSPRAGRAGDTMRMILLTLQANSVRNVAKMKARRLGSLEALERKIRKNKGGWREVKFVRKVGLKRDPESRKATP